MYRHTGKLITLVVLLAASASSEVQAPDIERSSRALRLEQGIGAQRHEIPVEVDCRPDGETLFRVGPLDLSEPVVYEFDDSIQSTCSPSPTEVRPAEDVPL